MKLRLFVTHLTVFLVVSALFVVQVQSQVQQGPDDVLAPGATERGSVELNSWHCYEIPVQSRQSDNGGVWETRKAFRLLIVVTRDSSLFDFQLYASEWNSDSNSLRLCQLGSFSFSDLEHRKRRPVRTHLKSMRVRQDCWKQLHFRRVICNK